MRGLDRLSIPATIGVGTAMAVLAGALGAIIDLLTGTRGWWVALGALGLCAGALTVAAAATRTPIGRQPR